MIEIIEDCPSFKGLEFIEAAAFHRKIDELHSEWGLRFFKAIDNLGEYKISQFIYDHRKVALFSRCDVYDDPSVITIMLDPSCRNLRNLLDGVMRFFRIPENTLAWINPNLESERWVLVTTDGIKDKIIMNYFNETVAMHAKRYYEEQEPEKSYRVKKYS